MTFNALIWALWGLAALPSSTIAQSISTTARCGTEFGLTCEGSQFGNCCSQYGYCGASAAYCADGCQVGYGDCGVRGSAISQDGRCGIDSGYQICSGSTFGNCCSQWGYCGSSSAYCSDGCQIDYGSCGTASPSATPSSISGSPVSSASSATSSAPCVPTNLFTNPSFETGKQTPWINGGAVHAYTYSIQKTGGHDSNHWYGIKFTVNGQDPAYLFQPITVQVDTLVQASGWAQLESASTLPISVGWQWDNGINTDVGSSTALSLQGGEGWQQFKSDPFTLKAGAQNSVWINVHKPEEPSPAGFLGLDDFSLTVICGS